MTLDLGSHRFMLRLLMMMRTYFALLLAICCSRLAAEPAPYYQWRSKADGTLACSQTPLGPGWEKASGPYRDSHCRRKIIVTRVF